MRSKRISILYSIVLVVIFSVCANAQTEHTNSAPIGGTGDKALVIKKKPHARATGCRLGTSGSAVVAVTFDKSGVVSGTELLASSGCTSFDKSALNAATKIKFDPALANGEPKTVKKRVEYTYRIF